MHLRTTLLLLLVVAALGAVILGIERYLPSTRDLREMKKGPIKFVRTEVTQMEIDSSGGDGVTLAREEDVWWVRRPFNDRADPERTDKLLTELQAIGWIERVYPGEFDEAGWAKTALEQPRHKLRLSSGAKPVLELWVGSPTAIEGSHYLAIQKTEDDAEPAYYVAKTTLPDLLKPAPKDWRDGKLVRLAAEQISGVVLAQQSGQIELARVDSKGRWAILKPLSARGNTEKINEMVSTLLNLEIKEAVEVAGSTPSGSGLESANGNAEINPQSLKVTLMTGEAGKKIELTLTKPEGDSIETKATADHRRPVFTVQAKSLKDLWAQPNDLRDRMLARIDPEAIAKIKIESLTFAAVELEKQNESWFLKRHGKMEPANGDRVSGLFEALNTHQVVNFTSDSAANLSAYGLDKPFMTLSFTSAQGRSGKLIFGANASSTEFFAKFDSETSVYQIEPSLLPSIPQDGIKWRGLGALRFTQFALRRISLGVGAQPPVVLNYDPTTAQWTGERAGRDITAMIDRVKADRLAGSLAKFSVQDWSADASNALVALKEPALRVVVTLGEPGTNSGPTRDTVINFAPTQPGMDTTLYYGRVNEGPDVFYVTRSALLELLPSVFKQE